MKKNLIFLISVHIVLTLLFLLSGFAFLKKVSTAEVHTMQNLAGALICEFPETESSFLRALQNPTPEKQAEGALLLSRYGYNEADFLVKSSFYRRGILTCACMVILLFLLSLGSCCRFFYTVKREQKAETAKLRALLERCLDDDYGFLDQPRDIPPLKREELSDAFLRLAQKLRLKSEALLEEKDHTKTLVTDISHQLKTPLSALKSCFSLYQEADTAEEQAEFGGRCLFQLEKLENLISSLIHISRLETAMICLAPAAVSFTDILMDAINGIYEKAAAKRIEIAAGELEDTVLFLDRKWTAEALFNVLDNAVKYSPPDSSLFIRVQKLYSFLRVEIEDQGIGIPREEYNKIFKRFYRGRQEAVQQTEGAGVGLYLARKILEEQGATLSVKAAATQGSIFVVQLSLGTRERP